VGRKESFTSLEITIIIIIKKYWEEERNKNRHLT
jgi:hypothetical protein